MAAQENELKSGFWISEDDWQKLGQTILALEALSSLVAGPTQNITIPSSEVLALIDLYKDRLIRIHESGVYVR